MSLPTATPRDPATSEIGRYGDLELPQARALAEEYAPQMRAIIARIPAKYGWGLWIGPGWFPIVAELDAALATVNPDYEVHQVKEKFGRLRYYIGYTDDQAVISLIRAATSRAAVTCERCGDPGVLRSEGGSLRTTCERCAPDYATLVVDAPPRRI